MASSIDAAKPEEGRATTQSVRDNFSAAKTEIEALQAADTSLAGRITTIEGWTAADIPFTPAGGISAADVQAALEELDTEKQSASSLYQWLAFALSDETTALTAGAGKLTVRLPACTIIGLPRASLNAASASGAVTVDINEAGVSILGNKLSIDQGEKTSTTAATPVTVTDTAIADDAEVTFDIDGAGSGAAGLKVYMKVRWS